MSTSNLIITHIEHTISNNNNNNNNNYDNNNKSPVCLQYIYHYRF